MVLKSIREDIKTTGGVGALCFKCLEWCHLNNLWILIQCSPGPSHRAPSWSAGRTAASPIDFTATVLPSWGNSGFALTVEKMPAVPKRSQCPGPTHLPLYPDQILGPHSLPWPLCLQYQPCLLFHRYSERRRPASPRGAGTRAAAGSVFSQREPQ